MTLFDEKYQVVRVEAQRLTIRGIRSGKMLVINTESEFAFAEENYPVGTLIVLSDPSSEPHD